MSGETFSMTIEPDGHFVAVRSRPSSKRRCVRACRCRSRVVIWHLPRLSLPAVGGRGVVSHRMARTHTAEEKAEGWILPCAALAASDVTIDQPAIRQAQPPARPTRSRGF